LVFTAGSSNVHATNFLQESGQAAALLDRRAVLVTAFPEQLPPGMPSGVIATTFAPFSELLPRASALIYHGGIGTLAQAVAAGIPHLVMPLSHDQPDNADRLRRLGVGDAIAPGRYRAAAVAAKLRRLLADEQVAERCRRLKGQVDFAAGLDAACTAIDGALRIMLT
jgi:UDP:flavonoid glycosyltransferase YjiC (YdhE family)